MEKLPYYKMWVADAEVDENFRAMNDTELGFYWRCLNHSWINLGLPLDPGERARALRTSRKAADKHWLRVGRCFAENGDRYFNRRQEKERIRAREKSGKCSDAVRTRYERMNERSSGDGTDDLLRARARPDSDYDSDSVVVGEVVEEVSLILPDQKFQECMGVFIGFGIEVSEVDLRDCAAKWLSLDSVEQRSAHEYADRMAEPGGLWRRRGTEFIPRPWNYLREQHWKRKAAQWVIPEEREKSRTEQNQAAAAERFIRESGGVV